MPPLSLEQVLARSMRLPRQRARHQVSALFSSSQAGADVTYRSHPPPPPPAQPSASRRPLQPRQQAQRLSFFQLMDAQDAQRSAGHLQIQHGASDARVKNSADLLSFLVTAQRMGDWQDALRAFLQATETTLEGDTTTHPDSGTSRLRLMRAPPAPPAVPRGQAAPAPAARSPAPAVAAVEPMLVNPSEAHVSAVMDACADDEQWPVVVALCQFFGPAFPALITQGTTRIVNATTPAAVAGAGSARAKSAPGRTQWQRGLHFLKEELALQPSLIPVGAFNVCLSACEAEKDWRAALQVIRQMGPNPLQSVTLEGDTASVAETTPSPEVDSTNRGPSPDVVSYATLIATMEQAGKSALVPQILNRLPPVEKEEITASYAALIYVWSNQVYGKQNRRF